MAGNAKSGRKPTAKPTIPVMFRLPPAVIAKAKRKATADGLPFATWLRQSITRIVEAR